MEKTQEILAAERQQAQENFEKIRDNYNRATEKLHTASVAIAWLLAQGVQPAAQTLEDWRALEAESNTAFAIYMETPIP